jgi:hypothetical protein
MTDDHTDRSMELGESGEQSEGEEEKEETPKAEAAIKKAPTLPAAKKKATTEDSDSDGLDLDLGFSDGGEGDDEELLNQTGSDEREGGPSDRRSGGGDYGARGDDKSLGVGRGGGNIGGGNVRGGNSVSAGGGGSAGARSNRISFEDDDDVSPAKRSRNPRRDSNRRDSNRRDSNRRDSNKEAQERLVAFDATSRRKSADEDKLHTEVGRPNNPPECHLELINTPLRRWAVCETLRPKERI